MLQEMFKDLLEIPGPPGFEHGVRKRMRHYLSQHTDEIVQDRLGGIFGVVKGTNQKPKVMVAGHLDEVGFIITNLTSNGFLKFAALGGWWPHTLLAQKIKIVTRSGKEICGVIGSTPPHLLSDEQRNKVLSISEMFIDVGAVSAQELSQWGVNVGDFAVPDFPFQEMAGGRRWLGKAWDNRFGCGMALEVLANLKQINHPNTVYAGATVQEEVGLRGAKVAAEMIKPDIFFGLDTGPAGDTPGIKDGYGELGKGILIRVLDRSMILLPKLRDFLLDVAQTENIPYQFFVSKGGTDAGAVHTSGIGVPSVGLGICARYIHSHASIVDREDVEVCKQYLLAIIKEMNWSTYQTLFVD